LLLLEMDIPLRRHCCCRYFLVCSEQIDFISDILLWAYSNWARWDSSSLVSLPTWFW